ncbi:MAG: cysteine--tRNA ligase [bacterium]
MDIYLHNTLTRAKEKFIPIKKGEVGMYNCGPTVYDHPHIGNLRTLIFGDILRRVFEYNSYKVIQVMNITDVDDKTIKKSKAEKVSLYDFTSKYEKVFRDNMELLNVKTPHRMPRATEFMQDMIEMIEKMLESGVAYKSDDGVYFSIEKSEGYGALAQLKVDHSEKATAEDEYDKENAHDFALWKFAKPEDGENVWPASFGDGRPGWHIECSAMSLKLLGDTFDIHTGGEDLIFPHHTNEIAQSEAVTHKHFVNYWMHGAFMNVSGEKMAKSKGNFITLETIIDEGYSPLDFRYLILTANYRTKLDFSKESLNSCAQARKKINRAISELPDFGSVQKDLLNIFNEVINDDLNIPEGLALAWKILKDDEIAPADKKATILDFDRVFGLKLGESEKVEIPQKVFDLVDAREVARNEKDWEEADRYRDLIQQLGFVVKDTANGPQILPL